MTRGTRTLVWASLLLVVAFASCQHSIARGELAEASQSGRKKLNNSARYRRQAGEPIFTTLVSDDEESCGWEKWRLPKRFIPEHYDLLIIPHLERDTFEGTVNVTLRVVEEPEAARAKRHAASPSGSSRASGLQQSRQQQQGSEADNELPAGEPSSSAASSASSATASASTNGTSVEPLLGANMIVLHAHASMNITWVRYVEISAEEVASRAARPPVELRRRSILDKVQQRSSGPSRGDAKPRRRLRRWLADMEDAKDEAAEDTDDARSSPANSNPVRDICRDDQHDFLIITLARPIRAGSFGRLEVSFAGELADEPRGFYKSNYVAREWLSYQKRAGQARAPRPQATTQFQPTEARRAFPCFDEPALKATFQLSLVRPLGKTAVANTDPVAVEPFGGAPSLELVRFARTPRMSTYLLAYALGDFEYLESIDERAASGSGQLRRRQVSGAGDHDHDDVDELYDPDESVMAHWLATGAGSAGSRARESDTESASGSEPAGARRRRLRVRVYTPPGRREEGALGLALAVDTVRALEDYANISYPLAKLDLLSVRNFKGGAMENWGLVIFRENSLLLNRTEAGPQKRAAIVSTIIHELAHQWFGNLVTMRWWQDVWLNEGFATFFEYELARRLRPQMDFDSIYLLDSHIYALEEDALAGNLTHAVWGPEPEEPASIEALFDAIEYNKAGALLRWLHAEPELLVGARAFQAALRDYLARAAYASVSAQDLIQAFKRHARAPSSSAMLEPFIQSWLKQSGHPLLHASLRAQPSRMRGQRTSPPNMSANLTSAHSGAPEYWLEVAQERFQVDRRSGQQPVDGLWLVPLVVELAQPGRPRHQLRLWLTERRQRFKLPAWFVPATDSPQGGWLLLNPGFVGLYRVRYSLQLHSLLRLPLAALADASQAEAREGAASGASTPPMRSADKLQLLNGLGSLITARREPIGRLLDVLILMEQSRVAQSGAVLDDVVGQMQWLERLFEQADDAELQQLYMALERRLLAHQARAFGHFNASRSASLVELRARASALSELVRLGDQETIARALRLFDVLAGGEEPAGAQARARRAAPQQLAADADTHEDKNEDQDEDQDEERRAAREPAFRFAIYLAAARHGTASQWRALFALFARLPALGSDEDSERSWFGVERAHLARALLLTASSQPKRFASAWSWFVEGEGASSLSIERAELLASLLDTAPEDVGRARALIWRTLIKLALTNQLADFADSPAALERLVEELSRVAPAEQADADRRLEARVLLLGQELDGPRIRERVRRQLEWQRAQLASTPSRALREALLRYRPALSAR